MRRIRTAERRGAVPGSRPGVAVAGRHPPLSRAAVVRAATLTCERERRRANLSIAFVGPRRMRRLNAEWKGHDRPTDVLAFTLTQPDGTVEGDVYICRAVAEREARRRGIGVAEELRRLVIHGTLHVLGHDHPEDGSRMSSDMWRRQERYLACLS